MLEEFLIQILGKNIAEAALIFVSIGLGVAIFLKIVKSLIKSFNVDF